MSHRTAIQPVILSGGAGSRLWPMSRRALPKQLLSLTGEQSMLMLTAGRVADPAIFAPALVICNEEQRFIIAEQFREAAATRAPGDVVPQLGRLLVEPVARNTAPAATAAALAAQEQLGPEATILLLPADHLITDLAAFQAAIDRAAAAVADGRIVTFGMTPGHPATGYGYIRQGEALDGQSGVYTVSAFTEKPDRTTAAAYLDAGGYFWNAGIFFTRADVWLAECERLALGIVEPVRQAMAAGRQDLDFLRLEAEAFAAAKSISIDYAVMEHTDRAAVVPAEIGWSDIGNWDELWRLAEQDGAGNAIIGDVVALDSHGCYLRSEHPLVATLGVRDLLVVATKDVVLVADRHEAQQVGQLVKALEAAGRPEATEHPRVFRPWGSYESMAQGARFQVKTITVKPGQRLSLQKHHHRAEHWVVVQGTAVVTRDDEELLLSENQSVYLPLGCVHRLHNPGKIPLTLIEVQSGSYLGEDDIVRLEDDYRRS